MEKLNRRITLILLCLISIVLLQIQPLFAGGWSNTEKITKLELVRGQGVAIYGNFGNPASCTQSNMWWIKIDHPQYDKLYALLMAAMLSEKKIRGYAHKCEEFGWHGGSYNTINGAGSLYIVN